MSRPELECVACSVDESPPTVVVHEAKAYNAHHGFMHFVFTIRARVTLNWDQAEQALVACYPSHEICRHPGSDNLKPLIDCRLAGSFGQMNEFAGLIDAKFCSPETYISDLVVASKRQYGFMHRNNGLFAKIMMKYRKSRSETIVSIRFMKTLDSVARAIPVNDRFWFEPTKKLTVPKRSHDASEMVVKTFAQVEAETAAAEASRQRGIVRRAAGVRRAAERKDKTEKKRLKREEKYGSGLDDFGF